MAILDGKLSIELNFLQLAEEFVHLGGSSTSKHGKKKMGTGDGRNNA